MVAVFPEPDDTKIRAHDVDDRPAYGPTSIVCIEMGVSRLQFTTRAEAAAWLEHTVARFNIAMHDLGAGERAFPGSSFYDAEVTA